MTTSKDSVPLRTDRISDFSMDGRSFKRDESGYLVQPGDWDEAVCEIIAAEEDIALTDDHWAIVRFIRAYHDEHSVAPDARFAFNHLADLRHLSKADARRLFFELFPYGYVKQACKIAGMLQPRAWSTG